MKRWVAASSAGALALLLLSAGGVGYVSWRSADELVHPARSTAEATPADAGLAFEAVRFDATDGLPLAAWWVPAEASRGTVIFLHGYADSKAQSVPLLRFLHEAGYHVLAYDARAHGESAGDATTVGLDETRDVEGALAYVVDRDPRAALQLALLGFSMGAATALNAAPGLASDDEARVDVDAIVSDSAFATLTNIASNSITQFTDLPKYPFGPLSVTFAGAIVGRDVRDNAPVRAAAAAKAPVLVIQGLDDTIALPGDDGEAIAAAAPEGSALWLVPGAAHVEAHAIATQEYEARVLAFLDEHLSG